MVPSEFAHFVFAKVDAAATRRRLQTAVFHNLSQQLVRRYDFVVSSAGVALDARHLQQVCDQPRDPVDLFFRALEGVLAGWALAHEFQRKAEARERGAELVRDVLQKSPFGGEECFNAERHLVESHAEFSDLVLALEVCARAQVSLSEAHHRLTQAADRPCQSERKRIGE